jgi:uncharacterized protein involved in propanediol utilization
MHHCLVTLPCSLFGSAAFFRMNSSARLTILPANRSKALNAARMALRESGFEKAGGSLHLFSSIPPGRGMGASTCDCLAAIRAVFDYLRCDFHPELIAKWLVAADLAADPLMYLENSVLFAQREGRILEAFAGPLPAVRVLGFDTDPSRSSINTSAFPLAHYRANQLARFRVLLTALRRSIEHQDARLLGQVATASAILNQGFLPKPCFDVLLKLVERTEALGLQVAHSGTVAGLLFDPSGPDVEEQMSVASASLQELKCHDQWTFDTLWRHP